MLYKIDGLLAYERYMETEARYAILLGGAGSGKSVAAAMKVVTRAFEVRGLRQLVIRKVAATLRNSVHAQIWSVILDLEGQDRVRYVSSQRAFYFNNGSEILLHGLDDPEKIKSIQGIGSVWVEEATELEKQDLDQLELRMRGKTPGYKQFTLTFNPIDEMHWLRERFCTAEAQAKDKEIFFMTTTYRDNKFLDEAYIAHLEERIRHDENLYRIYSLGLWGRAYAGGLYYKNFKMGEHVGSYVYKQEVPLHLSFDFNVQPYMTATIWQTEGTNTWQINEFCLSSPLNTSHAICTHFLAKYADHIGGLWIHGDPSGMAHSTSNQYGESDYGLIARLLAPMKPRMAVLSSAPGLVPRGLFINSIFGQSFAGIELRIDKECRKTLLDYQNVQETQDGHKLKPKKRDAETKLVSEVYGHTSDANDYFICSYFKAQYGAFHRPRKMLPPILTGR